jgi:hypothetical protein
MDKTYKVIFSGLLKEAEYFKGQMLKLGVSENVSNGIIKKAPVILKQGLSLKHAETYADAIIRAGGKAVLQVEKFPEGNHEKVTSSRVISLKNFTMCPQCGFKQLKTGTCIRCSLKFEV